MTDATTVELDTLPDLLAPVLARAATIIGVAFACAVIGYAVSFMIEPRYRISTTIAPANHEGPGALSNASGLSQLSSLVGLGSSMQGDFVRDSLGILRSDALIARFIEERDLIDVLYDDDDEEMAERRTLADAVDFFDQRVLGIEQDSFTGLLTVSVDWQDPAIAVDWANGFVDLANRQISERTILNAERGNEYLAANLEQHNSLGLRQSIYRLMENNMNMAMLATTRAEFAFTVLDPAATPALDDYSWPNRKLLAAFGLVAGGGLAVTVVLLLHWRRRRAEESTSARA